MFGPNGLVYDIETANSETGGSSPTASPDVSFFNSAVPGFEYVTSSALFNSLQYHLQVQAPTIVSGDPRVVDQYNQFYMQYVSMFSAGSRRRHSSAPTRVRAQTAPRTRLMILPSTTATICNA
jgi:hypothetical protein